MKWTQYFILMLMVSFGLAGCVNESMQERKATLSTPDISVDSDAVAENSRSAEMPEAIPEEISEEHDNAEPEAEISQPIAQAVEYTDAFYRCWMLYNEGNEFEGHFVPLSDSYPLSEHPDSSAVDADLLEDRDLGGAFKRALPAANRKIVLERLGLTEADSIFIYDIENGKVTAVPIATTPLVTSPNIYGVSSVLSQYDFLFGFRLEGLPISRTFYDGPIAYAGPENPFIEEKLQPFKWQQFSGEFPETEIDAESQAQIDRMEAIDTFMYRQDGLTHFILNYGVIKSTYTSTVYRRVVTVDEQTDEVCFNGHFLNSEGCDLHPLNDSLQPLQEQYQWTGYLLKDKPPVIMGFNSLAFGCNRMFFASDTVAPIFLRCDNRH